jgi:hypothetical protein
MTSLTRGVTRRPCSHRGQNLVQWVSDLINTVMGTWDEELIWQTFHQDGMQTILAIPVHEDMDDVVGWHFDSKGRFSVKSAYKVFIEDASNGQGSSSEHHGHLSAAGCFFLWYKV